MDEPITMGQNLFLVGALIYYIWSLKKDLARLEKRICELESFIN